MSEGGRKGGTEGRRIGIGRRHEGGGKGGGREGEREGVGRKGGREIGKEWEVSGGRGLCRNELCGSGPQPRARRVAETERERHSTRRKERAGGTKGRWRETGKKGKKEERREGGGRKRGGETEEGREGRSE